MTISAGTRLDPYEILAPLGADGMGRVGKTAAPRYTGRVHREFIHDPDDNW